MHLRVAALEESCIYSARLGTTGYMCISECLCAVTQQKMNHLEFCSVHGPLHLRGNMQRWEYTREAFVLENA